MAVDTVIRQYCNFGAILNFQTSLKL